MRCILDSGSLIETITEEAANRLQLPQFKSNIQLLGTGGSITTSKKIIARIGSTHTNILMDVEMVIVPKILESQPNKYINRSKLEFPEEFLEFPLADPEFHKMRPLDILLGSRVFYQMLGPNQIRSGRSPTVQHCYSSFLSLTIARKGYSIPVQIIVDYKLCRLSELFGL